MGENKSLLKLEGITFIEKTTNLMKNIFEDVIIITNTPYEYKFLDLPLYEDIYKEKGPMGGIHSGLTYSTTDRNFVISCDTPLMTREMIQYLVEYNTKHPVLFCEAAGYHQPLAGIYEKKILPVIEKILEDNSITDKKSIHRFLNNVDKEIINPEELPFYEDTIFFNVNKPEDYEIILNYTEK
jgi:molybdopterin-guanine dinucleotide biosynthesis protein A